MNIIINVVINLLELDLCLQIYVTFRVATPTIWNNLPNFIKVADSFNVFWRRLKCHLFDTAFRQPSFPTGVSVSQPHKQKISAPSINKIVLFCRPSVLFRSGNRNLEFLLFIYLFKR